MPTRLVLDHGIHLTVARILDCAHLVLAAVSSPSSNNVGQLNKGVVGSRKLCQEEEVAIDSARDFGGPCVDQDFVYLFPIWLDQYKVA